MKKKSIIIGLLLITITLGITYAWWNWQSSTNTNVTFTIEGATITYNAGPDISNIKLIPVSTKEKGVTDNTAVYKEITASANSSMYLTLNLDLVTFPSNLAAASLVWEIYKGTTKIGNGNFANKSQGDSITLFENQEINSTSSLYKLYIWIDGNQENTSSMMNQSFVFHLNATATDEAPSSALPDFILNSNAPLDSVNSTYVQNQTPGIDYTQSSSDTNGKGLYIRTGTENDLNPIYYYRGAVENNNVYFANYCWKIVRTTDTGGLKMIYNGAPTSGSCGSGVESQSNSTIGNSKFNTNYNDPKYAGYTYDNNGVETDSTVKGIIDDWYEDNILTNYDNYIEDTVYCNDSELATSTETNQIKTAWSINDNNFVTYKSMVRVMNTTPSLECVNNADKYTKSNTIGNGKLTYPVGLLTMDEIWIAGVGMEEIDEETWQRPTSYYLDNGSYWWSITPSNYIFGNNTFWSSYAEYGLSDGYSIYTPGDKAYIRPVISLASGQNFEYGNGTVSNPYRFVATVPNN